MLLDVVSRDYLKYGVLAGLGAAALSGGIYWLIKKMRKVNSGNLECPVIRNTS